MKKNNKKKNDYSFLLTSNKIVREGNDVYMSSS